jgi:hypothetical protein
MKFLRLLGVARLSIPRVIPLMRDPVVPFWLKAATIGLALAIASPLDLLGDIPVIGLFDDVALLAVLVSAFVAIAETLRERLLVRVDPLAMREPRIVNPRGPRDARIVEPPAAALPK